MELNMRIAATYLAVVFLGFFPAVAFAGQEMEMKSPSSHEMGEHKMHDMKSAPKHEMKDHKAHKEMLTSERGMKWMAVANEKLGAKLDGGLTFIDQNGRKVKLGDYFDKPLFVTFIFADCPEVCPTIVSTLSQAVERAKKKHGDSFRVVTISFDPQRDSAGRMKEYGGEFTDDFKFWTFGVIPKESVEKMTGAFGFSYIPNKDIIWNHIAMVTAVDKGGLIVKQLFGMNVSADDFMQTLEALHAK